MRTKKKSKQAGYATAPADPSVLRAEVMFDLDGTLAENTWPSSHVGEPIPEMVDLLKDYVGKGFACSIFTSRPEDHRGVIMDWLFYHDLHQLVYRVITEKPPYGLLIDDRSWNPWHTTRPSKTKSSKRSSNF